MRIRGLLAATLALAVLGGLVWWSIRSKPEDGSVKDSHGHSHPSGQDDAGEPILSLNKDQIRKLEIRRALGETTVASRERSGPWMISQPKSFPADPDAMKALLDALGDLHAEKLVDPQTPDFAPFGLTQPSVAITATMQDGKTHTLLVGDETPSSGAFYVRTGADKRLFTIAGFTKAGLDRTSSDLRDKRLLTFGKDFLTRLELVSNSGAIEFARAGQNDWKILKPSILRADGWQVDELLRSLAETRLDASVSDETARQNERAFASAPPFVTVRLTDPQGVQTLEVRKSSRSLLVKSSAVPGVHALPSDALSAIGRSADGFRNKKLFDFGFNEPSRIEFTDGPRTRVFSKAKDSWSESGKSIDSIAVQSLIDRLRDLTAAGFPAKGGAEAEMSISVTTGKAAEKISISRSGDAFFAVRSGEPDIYSLASPDVQALRQAASDVKPSPPGAPEKK
jgi:hypothetical protein